jgi:hypothetical protein
MKRRLTKAERPSIWMNNRCCSRCYPFDRVHIKARTIAEGVEMIKRARRVNVVAQITNHPDDRRLFEVAKKEAVYELCRVESVHGSGAKVSLLLDDLDGHHAAFIG